MPIWNKNEEQKIKKVDESVLIIIKIVIRFKVLKALSFPGFLSTLRLYIYPLGSFLCDPGISINLIIINRPAMPKNVAPIVKILIDNIILN